MSTFFSFSFVQSSVTEIVLCFCMLYKAWIIYKNSYGSQLLKLLIADSVLYFASIFAVLLTNTLVGFITPRGLVQIAIGWEYAIPCTMGSRLLLSMFEQAFKQRMSTDQSRHTPSYLLSDIRMQGLSASPVEPPSVLTMSVLESVGK
ncbi:hypothetical protein JB92DRAFT_2948497 [Gautieria morchelliformis]|nr:hypothetical protein JB92DRAFT_2948497 [Gautieria morchelliformis]